MANRITVQKFRKLYNNVLLFNPSSANYEVGCQFEYEAGSGRRMFEIGTYFSSYIPLADADSEYFEAYFDKIGTDEPDQAVFAGLDITTSIDIKLGLKITYVKMDIGATINYADVTRISFEEVSCRSLMHDKRTAGRMIKILADSKAKNPKQFKRLIEPVMFLHDVYYAKKVKISIDNGWGANLKVKLEDLGIGFDVDGNLKTLSTFTFEGNTSVPFAGRIESLGDLIKSTRGR